MCWRIDHCGAVGAARYRHRPTAHAQVDRPQPRSSRRGIGISRGRLRCHVAEASRRSDANARGDFAGRPAAVAANDSSACRAADHAPRNATGQTSCAAATADRLGSVLRRQTFRLDRRLRSLPRDRVSREIFLREQSHYTGHARRDRDGVGYRPHRHRLVYRDTALSRLRTKSLRDRHPGSLRKYFCGARLLPFDRPRSRVRFNGDRDRGGVLPRSPHERAGNRGARSAGRISHPRPSLNRCRQSGCPLRLHRRFEYRDRGRRLAKAMGLSRRARSGRHRAHAVRLGR